MMDKQTVVQVFELGYNVNGSINQWIQAREREGFQFKEQTTVIGGTDLQAIITVVMEKEREVNRR